MRKMLFLLLAWTYVGVADAAVTVKSVTAQQRYPWNGKVDIVVTICGDLNAITLTECKRVWRETLASWRQKAKIEYFKASETKKGVSK